MLNKSKNIFIVGIKGAAMSNLAVILKEMGKQVSGCDVAEEFITDVILKKYGIPYSVGFDPVFLSKETDLVIYSAAHTGQENQIVIEAKKKGIKTVSQAKILGELLTHFKTSIAVSGCHGKTTTSSLLAYTLGKLGVKPSYIIGVPTFNDQPGGMYDGQDYFVIEADEYGVNPPVDKTPKLLHLRPTHIICTNIDFDHPDVYQDIEETKKTFLQFFGNKKLFLCVDDFHIKSIMSKLNRAQYHTFGFSSEADLQIQNPVVSETQSSFDLVYKRKNLGMFATSLFGEKNISNAAGVILILLDLGFDVQKIKNAIKDFASVKRRFEFVYKKKETYLFDDYGHHPAEIAATIAAARARFKDRRIVVIFQPHTYSRTLSLKREFAASLSKSDLCLIAPIFPSARENAKEFHVLSSDIEIEAGNERVKAFSTLTELLVQLKETVRPLDIIFTIGAGDIYKLKDEIIKMI